MKTWARGPDRPSLPPGVLHQALSDLCFEKCSRLIMLSVQFFFFFFLSFSRMAEANRWTVGKETGRFLRLYEMDTKSLLKLGNSSMIP